MAVRRYEVLDTPPDHAFDRVTAIAAKHFGVPISIVTIVDSDRIWFKSAHGFEGVAEVGRDPGLCASAILQDEAWVVENAPLDPRALANPLVAGEFGLKFYAGWPLRTRDGHNLGTLCVIDRQPRKFTSDEAATLKEMAGIVVDELELRLSALRTTRAERLRRLEAERQAEILQRSMLAPVTPEVAGFEVAGRLLSGRGGDGGGAFYDCFELPDRVEGAVAVVVGEVHDDAGGLAAGVALARYMLRTAALS